MSLSKMSISEKCSMFLKEQQMSSFKDNLAYGESILRWIDFWSNVEQHQLCMMFFTCHTVQKVYPRQLSNIIYDCCKKNGIDVSFVDIKYSMFDNNTRTNVFSTWARFKNFGDVQKFIGGFKKFGCSFDNIIKFFDNLEFSKEEFTYEELIKRPNNKYIFPVPPEQIEQYNLHKATRYYNGPIRNQQQNVHNRTPYSRDNVPRFRNMSLVNKFTKPNITTQKVFEQKQESTKMVHFNDSIIEDGELI